MTPAIQSKFKIRFAQSLDRSIKYMLIASLLFALMNVMVKAIPDIPVAQIVFMRSIVMFVIVFFLLKRRKIKVLGTKRKLLVLRGVFGSVGIAFFFYTLHHMPLASAVTVHYLTPVFTALIAFIFMKEKLSLFQWVFFAICFIGILLIKGFDERVDGFTILIGIIGTIGAASAYNIISYIKSSEHHLVIMFYFPFVTIPLVLIYIFFTGDWNWTGWLQWTFLIGIGLLTYGAQYYLTRAYQDGQVNKVSIITYLGIVYAFGFGFVFFDEWYTLKSFIGLAMVIFGVLMNIFYKTDTSLFAKRNNRIKPSS